MISKIALAPGQRPQQRLLLMPVPTNPVQHDVSFLALPGDPQQMPRSARYVGQVEWAWARGHDRIDAYWLSTTSRLLKYFPDRVNELGFEAL